ncbi:Extragenic suppressor of kinetochore protein 1 [Schizosaccharomyces pombe 972h-] [Rhizoctonia solani]|uniref:Extragenic suppressor of kinetochore protein 1 [Schizosaccharomyces pombe 972h-] n=1 Tax=Rhizoctonia solani TaxID=456999 RepID=A0A0K6FUX9_9AGAM|nr:Extragenic suppressor of kinetochore protein 1 [Schizosaccharomyces pombe 972h-] [Rhizoctonia solani]
MSMFWRFGFHGTNNIDNLLNQEEVSLEAILDHDDLLSECKQQNPRLIDYLQHPEVLQRLFAYVTGEIVSEGRGSFKYPYVSTEVLCCEIWSIVERCTENSAQILAPFWDTVLSMPPGELRTKASVAAHFSKISGTFLMKKPEEMLAFIKSIPDVVDRMLAHIESPPFVDLLFRIIQLDENPGNIGVMEWLSSQNFIPNLVDRLSPRYPSSVHLVVADLLKGIISVASPSPGSFNLNGPHDSGPTGPVTNRFVRELASTNIVETMVGFMLDDAPFGPPVDEVLRAAEERQKEAPQEVTLTVPSGLAGPPGIGLRSVTPVPPPDASSVHIEHASLPNAESATSSVTHIVSIFVELIRKNNSDYFEPYLFHTLRNRLMQIQQQLLDEMHELGADVDTSQRAQEERERERLERAMADMVDHLGIVHLGRFLRILAKRLPDFQELLRRPRSLNGYVPTSVGQLVPLTLERFRIIELYAELLHCSNMSLLNRRRGFGPSYDEQGRLMGGLDALEQLARVIDPNVSSDAMMDQSLDSDTVQDLKELPASSASTDCSSLISEDGSVDDEHADLEEDLASSRGSTKSSSAQPSSSSVMPPSGPSADATQEGSNEADPFSDPESGVGSSDMSTPRTDVSSSNTSTVRHSPVAEHYGVAIDRSAFEPSGDILKQKMIDLNIVSTILDFFFEFPWNNFLHNAVYDMLHQILTGRVDNELSRRVTIGMFRDARLVYRILEGSRRNDAVAAQQKGLRLGYMGHLILIADDIVAALEHYPHSLLEALSPYVPQPDWDNFVAGQYKETKERDMSQLGGGKPAVSAMGIGIGRGGPVGGLSANRFGDTPSPRMESAVGRGIGPVPREVRGGADFGPAEPDDSLIPSDPNPVTTEQPESNQSHSNSLSDEDEANDSSHSASGDFDISPVHFTPKDPFKSPMKDEDEDGDDDVSWGPFADPLRSTLPPSFDDEEDSFGEFQMPTGTAAEFEDSFDGFNTVTSTNIRGKIQEAVDDTMEEPTTPKASERRLSSSFETIDKPDQDDSWNSVWPTSETLTAAGGDRNSSKATSDAVADAMTSHIVPQ